MKKVLFNIVLFGIMFTAVFAILGTFSSAHANQAEISNNYYEYQTEETEEAAESSRLFPAETDVNTIELD